jgi:ketosteroid isomerase-like protein
MREIEHRCVAIEGNVWRRTSVSRFLAVVIAIWGLTVGASAQPLADRAAVEAVLAGYRLAVESRDGAAAERYFWPDSHVFEQGGAEGDFATYLAHHLGPELGEIASFDFDAIATEIEGSGDIAYASEVYTYAIAFVDTARTPVARRGVATSVLLRRDGAWRIAVYHASSRAPRPVTP